MSPNKNVSLSTQSKGFQEAMGETAAGFGVVLLANGVTLTSAELQCLLSQRWPRWRLTLSQQDLVHQGPVPTKQMSLYAFQY